MPTSPEEGTETEPHTAPLVTVVVPMRDEAASIVDCLNAISAQDLDLSCLEVVVVDGSSTDRGAALAAESLERLGFGSGRVVTNERATTPSNLNVGLGLAAGEFICRVDARSLIPADYVRTCVQVLTDREDVAAVGGRQLAIAPRSGPLGAGIARALNNRFTMGMSRYRRGASSGPTDTVYLGSYRTAQLRQIGGWNEDFATNQDFELNRRVARFGSVWFDARLEVGYKPRASLRELWRQYRRFGLWKAMYWRRTSDPPRPRQVGALVAPPVSLGALLVFAGLGSSSRRARVATLVMAVVGAAFALDEAGTEGRPARLSERVAAVMAMVAVMAGWTIGAYEGMLFRRTRRQPPHPSSAARDRSIA